MVWAPWDRLDTRSSTSGTLPVRRGSDHSLRRTRGQPPIWVIAAAGRLRLVATRVGSVAAVGAHAVVTCPAITGGRQDGPDREPEVAGQDAPAAGQVLDDGQPATAYRGERGLRGPRPGHAAAIADRHLERSSAQCPSHQYLDARQRPGVDDRVGQQLAHDDGCVTEI